MMFYQCTAGEKHVKNFEGQLAFISGAGSGIGRATAIALASNGVRLAVSDIEAESAAETVELIEKQGGVAQAFTLDVSDPVQVEAIAVSVQNQMGTPAILVNNAGISVGAYFIDSSLENWQRIIGINLMGVIHCSRAFVPAMVASEKPGHIVNIASLLGYTGAKGVSAYCTTKFGVMGFSESLRAEMAQYQIGVSAICPGIVRTNIINSGILESREDEADEIRETIEAFYERRNYPPERVAKAIIGAIRRNRAVVPVTPEAWLAYYLKRWTPGLVSWFAKRDLV